MSDGAFSGMNKMDLNVTSPSAVKCIFANGAEVSFEKLL